MLDPEIAILKARYRSEVSGALERALAGLERDERLLLRFYYVDNLTLTKIAVLQKVAVSTVFRRMSAITQAVLAAVKEELSRQLQLSTQSLDSLIRELQHEIILSLSHLLGTG
jgi:RNA polymerase sigma-70 factor